MMLWVLVEFNFTMSGGSTWSDNITVIWPNCNSYSNCKNVKGSSGPNLDKYNHKRGSQDKPALAK